MKGFSRTRPGVVAVRRPTVALLVLAVVGVVLAGCGSGTSSSASGSGWVVDSPSNSSGLRGTELGAPVAKPDLVLTDTTGKPYDLKAATAGRLTLLYFGYTHCPDVCPTTMADLGVALHQLPAAVQQRTAVVFVTSDPARDTPAVLKTWLANFDTTFVGLTGDLKTIDTAANAVGVPLEPPVRQSDGTYTVQHGAQVLAFEPDGKARMVYLAGTPVADYVHDLPLLASGQQ
ncbi:SCO family protein [Frankia sp. AgB1.8]|nr:SCO family protein [Frankia sp. AgB1.8]